MTTPHRLVVLALAAVTAAAIPACSKGNTSADDVPHIPASSDPGGKDLVEGAVIAAQEKQGGIRIYKITHVDDYPEPMGYEYNMIAYDPVCTSFEQAARVWKAHEATINFPHLMVRAANFMPRDHRTLFVEPVTEAERLTYTQVRDSRGAAFPPPLPAASAK